MIDEDDEAEEDRELLVVGVDVVAVLVAVPSFARRSAASSSVLSLLQKAKRAKAPAPLPLSRRSAEKTGATGMDWTPCSIASQRQKAQSFVTMSMASLSSSRYSCGTSTLLTSTVKK